MFTRMDHVAISVQDMDKVIAFYRDVIGMEKVFDREFDVQHGPHHRRARHAACASCT